MNRNPDQTATAPVWTVRLFGPDLPAVGVPATLTLTATGLQVDAGRVHLPAFALLHFRETGFGRSGVELSWEADDGPWAIHVLAPDAANALLAAAPLALLPRVRDFRLQQARLGKSRLLGWAVLGGVLALPLLLLGLFYVQADRLAEWLGRRIPIEEEQRFGREAFAQMRERLRLQDDGPAYAVIEALGQRLSVGSAYHYSFHLADDSAINAFAIPGGIVVVNRGLIAATHRPEELAGVLAHEIQHVEQRHSLHGVIKQLGLQAVWTAATGDLSGTLAGQLALQLADLKFSRDAESEADSRGFERLVRTGIDPSGMPAFFHILSERTGNAAAEFMSTHPLSNEREKRLSLALEALHDRPFTPLPAPVWPPQ